MKMLSSSKIGGQCKGELCPSARCEESAVLLGVIGSDGKTGYVNPRITIDASFVQEARKGRLPEARFRFAQVCIESRCAQWNGCRCGLIEKLLASPTAAQIAKSDRETLPKCTIRATCRWFGQVGGKACTVCPFVVHSVDETEAVPSVGMDVLFSAH